MSHSDATTMTPRLTLDMTLGDFPTSVTCLTENPSVFSITRGDVTLYISEETAAEISWVFYAAGLESMKEEK